jgi:hypothetical protein
MPATVISVPHQVVRWTIDTQASYPYFRSRFEAAVPVVDTDRMARLRAEQADWDTVLGAAAADAPYGFMRFWSTDVGATMRLAGHPAECASYLMGNHTIAERMYRHDPAVMLYAPLRAAITADARGVAWFSIDRPSSRFASFDRPEIAAVGAELDRKVLGLLHVLDVLVTGADLAAGTDR